MAYFLPSYIQKRALRYALTYLDFLETDDLDLDKLGVKIGRRNVIELKDVGFRIKRLATILRLPPAITLDRALIRLLRLTIPADLHISGIVVEIFGVDVSLKLHNGFSHQKPNIGQPRPGRALRPGAKSERPRIATPSVHDPGGASRATDNECVRDDTRAIPSSFDLAQSFLQSEPKEEQLELQEAIASQSQYMHSSTISSKDGDVGIGAPGGWSLPSFIADFFKGIGERLEVVIQDVTFTMEIKLSQDSAVKDDSTSDADGVKIMVKICKLFLPGLNLQDEEHTSMGGKRRLVVEDLRFFLLSDPEAFSQYSQSPAPSSPILTKPKSKQSSTSSAPPSESGTAPGPEKVTSSSMYSSEHGSIQTDSDHHSISEHHHEQGQQDFIDEFVANEDMDDMAIFGPRSQSSMSEEQLSESSSDSMPAFASVSNSDARSSGFFPTTSQPSHSTVTSTRHTEMPTVLLSQLSSSNRDVDNKGRAEMLARTGQLETSAYADLEESYPEDLAESKIFSHDEAESMYMSAVSNESGMRASKAMPGGWDWSESSEPEVTNMLPQNAEHGESTAKGPTLEGDRPEEGELADSGHEDAQTSIGQAAARNKSDDLDESSLVTKQLVSLDRVSVWLSLEHQELTSYDPPGTIRSNDRNDRAFGQDSVPFLDRSQQSQFLKGATESSSHDARGPHLYSHGTVASEHRQSQPVDYELEFSKIHVQLDFSVVRLLTVVAKEAFNTLESNKSRKPVADARKSAVMPAIIMRIGDGHLQICEQVPEDTFSPSAMAEVKLSCRNTTDDDALLSLRLSGIKLSTASRDSRTRQRFSISTLSLSHSTGELATFLHNAKMQSSVKDIDTFSQDALLARINSEGDVRNVDIQMKPLCVTLDLLKLDDILSRSGGLSSLLDLGNSIVSTSTIRSNPRRPERTKSRPRSVRFHVSPSETSMVDPVHAPSRKFNARIAGASVDIVGSTCALKFQCSAIKTVYRQEGLGMVIDRAKVEGPLLPNETGVADITIRLKTIRMEYLPAPNEQDLDRLLSLLTPSKNKYDDDDDIMVDTLLRQRRQGGVVRLNVDEVESSFDGLAYTSKLSKLVTELGKLSTVAKYLPEDDRPGILTFGLIKKLDCRFSPDSAMGELRLVVDRLEGAHVNIPSLMAAQIISLSLYRAEKDRLIGEVLPSSSPTGTTPPMLMCRFIADEMDPTIKLKLHNVCFEYSVPTAVALIGFGETLKSMSSSDSDGSEHSRTSPALKASASSSMSAASLAGRAKIAVALRDSAIGLSPNGMSSKAMVILTDVSLLTSVENKTDNTACLTARKASILVTNDAQRPNKTSGDTDRNVYFDENYQIQLLTQHGYVLASSISSASVTLKTFGKQRGTEQGMDIELRNNLLVLETCADSTQTLVSIFNNLSPPSPPSRTSKYRTETIVPIQDMLASFTGDAFVAEPGPDAGFRTGTGADSDEEVPEQQEVEYVSDFFQPEPEDDEDDADDLAESYLGSEIAESTASVPASVTPANMNESALATSKDDVMAHSQLDFKEDYFVPESAVGGTAHRWDSTQNTYGLPNERDVSSSPLRVRVRDVHIIWNLFDGYDWQSTRDRISDAVGEIEARASARRPRSKSRLSPGAEEEEEESVIGDFLFNSIYIGIPANKDPRELTSAINHDIDDLTSETGSSATTTTVTRPPGRDQRGARAKRKHLRLTRSRTHKMTFELEGISADFLVFPPGTGEVESSLDVRLKNLTVFDHLPTSTWRKFATYMQDAGVRETDTNMVHLEILNVKPIADLAASEMIVKVTVLPLRLHVDQDALDFMSRFFEFKDESVPASTVPSSPPFIQRAEVNPIRVKLDFKPKRVDYGGLRSGRTTEFMNFFVLDRADMVLRRVIVYGVSGFDKLGIMLNNIWTPDVKRNQLPGILAGLAPMRPLVDVSSGVRDLIVIPMREYKKDGRVVRSIQKGALAFAKTTTRELVNLGAKLAIGTQTVLQDTEAMLGPESGHDQWEDEGTEDDAKRQISLYADQPMGVVQGLQGAYASLERDLLLARDAIIAVPGAVMASGSATEAARAVLRQTPTIILRPAIGASKAVGKTLLGAGNSLDRDKWRRVDEKYKRH